MKWYIVVKIFAVVYMTTGPFDQKDDCIKQMIQYIDIAKARYSAGERIQFLGFTVKPKNVKVQCQQK